MSNLLDATRTLLKRAAEHEISLAEIARRAGSPVEYDWLKRFAAGDIDDPSVNRVQHLHDYLAAEYGRGKKQNGGGPSARAAAG